MATSAVQICNLALTEIGSDTISSLSEDTKRARVCNISYEATRDEVLRAHPWNFAITRSVLAENATTPVFEFDHSFALPVNCLRALRLEDPEHDFKIEGRDLLTNETAANLVYVKAVTNPVEFDAEFVATLVLRLASSLAVSLAQDKTLADAKYSQYTLKLKEARAMDAQEGTPDDQNVSTWINARY